MISASYVRTMARYNSWQNDQLISLLLDMPKEELTKDRGAFFGSILGTANHLLCGDMLWLSRLDPLMAPPFAAPDQWPRLHEDARRWATDRHRVDGKLHLWVDKLREIDLVGDVTCQPVTRGTAISLSRGMAVVQMFTHQTHHRGQIHAMLTAAGQAAPISDIIHMPEIV